MARYLLHPPLSLERMTYDDETGEVTYRSHRQHRLEKFDPLDWLARVASHIPEKGSQMVRYFGAYSNKTRGMRKKADGGAFYRSFFQHNARLQVLVKTRRQLVAYSLGCVLEDAILQGRGNRLRPKFVVAHGA